MIRNELIEDLANRTLEAISEAGKYKLLTLEALNHRPTPTGWSILECLEHLNRYGVFYLPEINRKVSKAPHSGNEVFKSGWIGNYFALSMLPGSDGKLRKMKTFKSMDPIHAHLEANVVDKFLDQQRQMLGLLEKAREVDLGKVKTSISISKWIKLKLGDTLRVVVYHNQRHIQQASRVLEALG